MKHERLPTPEQRVEPPTDVFGLDKLTPQQIAGLIEVIVEADDVDEQKTATPTAVIAELGWILGKDLAQLAEQAPDKAADVYFTLTGTDNVWTKSFAMDQLATPLVRHFGDDLEKRQQVLNAWIRMLDDKDDLVRTAARETLANLIEDEWLDEPTRMMIVGQIDGAEERDRRGLHQVE